MALKWKTTRKNKKKTNGQNRCNGEETIEIVYKLVEGKLRAGRTRGGGREVKCTAQKWKGRKFCSLFLLFFAFSLVFCLINLIKMQLSRVTEKMQLAKITIAYFQAARLESELSVRAKVCYIFLRLDLQLSRDRQREKIKLLQHTFALRSKSDLNARLKVCYTFGGNNSSHFGFKLSHNFCDFLQQIYCAHIWETRSEKLIENASNFWLLLHKIAASSKFNSRKWQLLALALAWWKLQAASCNLPSCYAKTFATTTNSGKLSFWSERGRGRRWSRWSVAQPDRDRFYSFFSHR